jgi:hypothetical protein
MPRHGSMPFQNPVQFVELNNQTHVVGTADRDVELSP